jgi:MFS superfamily sulfate permease-like transporter
LRLFLCVYISFKYFCSVNTAANKEDDGTTVAVWHIVVFLMSGIMIGILISYIVFCSRRKFRSRKPQSKPEPKTTEVDTTYQELDLSNMNTEDNYQSLRVNAASLYDAGNQTANDEDIYIVNIYRVEQNQRCGEQLSIFNLYYFKIRSR